VANDEIIYILDQITPKAGQAEIFLKHYLDTYAPLARERNMTLAHSWISPPLWLQGDQLNTLFMVWSVPGGAFGYLTAAMAHPGALDGSASFWWRDAEHMIATRSRSILSDTNDIASLNNV
jgi:hypothetical protein